MRNLRPWAPRVRALHGCCHVPESKAVKPELWEGAEREHCREHAFEFDAARTRFGRGVLNELGETAKALGMRRVAIFTDKKVASQPFFASALASIPAAGLEAIVYDEVQIEPTDKSFLAAAQWAADGSPDGVVSIGGGSAIDTAKAANLFASHPPPNGLSDFLHYVNAPVGRASPVPGPLLPHIACPTTAGTGSEGTGYAICDIEHLGVKTALANRMLKPALALVDPLTTHGLPQAVVAASGMDVVMHACESLTARPFYARPLGPAGAPRPLNQGSNPWSDIGCRETLRIAGRYFARALEDASDVEAREAMMWAATLAGTALNNAGTALPHGCSYPVSGGVKHGGAKKHYAPGSGYANRAGGSSAPLLPHGYAVAVMAPAAFAATAAGSPERHLEAAALLGHTMAGRGGPSGRPSAAWAPDEIGDILGEQVAAFVQRAGDCPMGLAELGFTSDDVPTMVQGTIVQQRVLSVVPVAVDEELLAATFERAIAGFR